MLRIASSHVNQGNYKNKQEITFFLLWLGARINHIFRLFDGLLLWFLYLDDEILLSCFDEIVRVNDSISKHLGSMFIKIDLEDAILLSLYDI